MVDWMQLLINYWWVILIVMAAIFLAIRVRDFFRFFTTLIIGLAICYAATLAFLPPTTIPSLNFTKVLGVSTHSEEGKESDSQNTTENSECDEAATDQENATNCTQTSTVPANNLNFQMPNFKEMIGQYVVIE